MAQYYIFKNIRALLTDGFDRAELLTFCFDEPVFRDLYEEITELSSKAELVLKILDHANRRLELESLLEWASRRNPSRFEAQQPYKYADALDRGYSPDPGELADLAQVLPDNDLGKGLTLGGEFRGIPLKIVASSWADYGPIGQVRSGWLFIPQWTTSHSVAFFKVHTFEDGQGYIHIVDVANPEHLIWLSTMTGFKKEEQFHYAVNPADLWQFTWRTNPVG